MGVVVAVGGQEDDAATASLSASTAARRCAHVFVVSSSATNVNGPCFDAVDLLRTTTMEELKQATSRHLQELFSDGKVQAPISAFDLLVQFISLPSASSSKPAFRLTDLHKLEEVLEELSESWDAGSLSVLRDDDGLTLMHVQLETNGAVCRKRKRHVDEDADSAEEEEALSAPSPTKSVAGTTALNSLSKDMQEIYFLLQRGTARGKLLAEEVRRPIR